MSKKKSKGAKIPHNVSHKMIPQYLPIFEISGFFFSYNKELKETERLKYNHVRAHSKLGTLVKTDAVKEN